MRTNPVIGENILLKSLLHKEDFKNGRHVCKLLQFNNYYEDIVESQSTRYHRCQTCDKHGSDGNSHDHFLDSTHEL